MKIEDIQSVEPLQKNEDTDSKFGPKFKVTMKDGSSVETYTDPRENLLGGDGGCSINLGCCIFNCCIKETPPPQTTIVVVNVTEVTSWCSIM